MGSFTFSDVWERICQATGWRKQWELAKFLGIKPASVSGAKSRGHFPVEWAFKVAQWTGLSTDWVMTGKGPMSREENRARDKCSREVPFDHVDDIDYDEYTLVSRLDVGPEEDVRSTSPIGHRMIDCLPFKTNWLKYGLGLDPGQLALTLMRGDSMAPTFQENDFLLLDLRQRSFESDGLFAIRLKETQYVRRLQRNVDGSAYVIADNTSYKSQIVLSEQIDKLYIIGRVVWVWCGIKT